MTRTQFFVCIFVILALGIMGVGEVYHGHAISALRAGQAELGEKISELILSQNDLGRRIDNLAAALGQPIVETGLASWYGDESGEITAMGKRFDKWAMTAAHKKIPFGTLCLVINQRNGRRVLVRISDRGPYHGNRILDLSEGAARELGMIHAGVVPVRMYLIAAALPIARPGAGD